MRSTQLELGNHVLLQQKGFQTKHKIADLWENITYEVIEKLTDVPVCKICELPKWGDDTDESHPLCTKVVHRNMLFSLDWTVNNIPEDRDNDKRLLDHQAGTQQCEDTDKMNPVKKLVYNLWGMAVRTSHYILGWWR